MRYRCVTQYMYMVRRAMAPSSSCGWSYLIVRRPLSRPAGQITRTEAVTRTNALNSIPASLAGDKQPPPSLCSPSTSISSQRPTHEMTRRDDTMKLLLRTDALPPTLLPMPPAPPPGSGTSLPSSAIWSLPEITALLVLFVFAAPRASSVHFW